MTTVGKLVGDSHEDEAVQITRSSSNQTQLARSIHMQALLLCQSINQSINQSTGQPTPERSFVDLQIKPQQWFTSPSDGLWANET